VWLRLSGLISGPDFSFLTGRDLDLDGGLKEDHQRLCVKVSLV